MGAALVLEVARVTGVAPVVDATLLKLPTKAWVKGIVLLSDVVLATRGVLPIFVALVKGDTLLIGDGLAPVVWLAMGVTVLEGVSLLCGFAMAAGGSLVT